MTYQRSQCGRPRVIIYGNTHEEVDGLEQLLYDVLRARGAEPVIKCFVGTLSRYLEYTRRSPYLILVVALPGPDGPEIVRTIRNNNRAARMVWLCSLKTALAAYHIRPTALEQFPATQEAIERAMDECGI